MINEIDRRFLVTERLYKQDLVRDGDVMLKDVKCINANTAQSLFIDNRKACIVQKDNVIEISSFVLDDGKDNELKKIIEFIKEDLRGKDYTYDLRRLVSKYRFKFTKSH